MFFLQTLHLKKISPKQSHIQESLNRVLDTDAILL